MTLSHPCRDCYRASRELWHGMTDDCTGCRARAVARSPQFFGVRKRQKLNTMYVEMLSELDLTHQQVKDAFAKDSMYSAWKVAEA